MRIGIVGIGRMGRVLAVRLAKTAELTLYDVCTAQLVKVAAATGAKAGESLAAAAEGDAVILALPDREVMDCIKEFNQLRQQPIAVINVATNVAQSALEHMAAAHVRCIGAKFIGHAGEMAAGERPVIIVHHQPEELVPLATEIFSQVGEVLTGDSDLVTQINTIAAEQAIEAAVHIEERLRAKGISNPAIARSAVGQVAAGIVKSYASGNLGPFAREIVRAVKKNLAAK